MARDELFEDEWVEISDVEGRKAAMRHLATIRFGEKTYMILGAAFEDALEDGALMLVREDRTVDGALEYVVSRDEQEIERVVGQFAMHLMDDPLPDEVLREIEEIGMDMQAMETPMEENCGCSHLPGEFCYCDDPQYLQ